VNFELVIRRSLGQTRTAMKTRRTVTIALSLTVVACAFVLALRSFAQSGPNDINLPNWQKLKAPYDDDADLWEKDILKKHAKKYCITHKKNNGNSSQHCPKSQAAPQSLIVPVGSSSAPAPMQSKAAGINVTQQVSCANQADHDAIVATFDMTQ
jgi:hypothetical protein